MADLEDQGYLYQPHTSAGRVPTASAYRFFAQQVAAQAKLSPEDEEWIRGEFAAATTPEEIAERAGHVLAEVSRGLGIVVSPPIAKTVLEHVRFVCCCADGRVVVSSGFDGRQYARQDYPSRAGKFQPARPRSNRLDYLNRRLVCWPHAGGDSHGSCRPSGERAGALRSFGARRLGSLRPRHAGAGRDAANLRRGRRADGGSA